MGSLDRHFGESIALPAAKQAEILKHLTAHSADRQESLRSVNVLKSLREGEPTPLAITRVPLVSGIHAGRLDPAFDPKPAPKTIANCTTCHSKAAEGNFSKIEFTVSDASFRSNVPALAVGLTPDEKVIPQAK